MKKRRLIARDLLRTEMADDPQVSPAGTKVAWVRTWIDVEGNNYRSAICISDAITGKADRLVDDGGLATHPRWSPDGQWLAYLTTRPIGVAQATVPQLCIIPASGGVPRTLTHLSHGFEEPVWSPDGERIAGVTRIDPVLGLNKPDVAFNQENPYAEFNRDVLIARQRNWKMDGIGYVGNLRRAVICVSRLFRKESVVTLLADAEFDLHTPVWSPDGTRLAAIGNLEPDADTTRQRHLYILNVANPDRPPRRLAGLEDIRHTRSAWSPDGSQIALTGHDNPAVGHYGNQQLWLINVDDGAKRCVTAQHDWTLGHAAYTDVGRYAGDSGIRWLPQSRDVLALRSQEGEVQVIRINVDSGSALPLTAGDGAIAAFSLDAGGQVMAALIREPLNPGDIYLFNLNETHACRRLTAVNQSWLDDIELSQPQKFRFNSDNVMIDAWILPPVNRPPHKRVPAVLYTGGGPAGMRAPNFFFDYQLLAAAGYALIFCNARGCQGYGEEFCTAILGAWGTYDYTDNMRCLEEACTRFDFIDPERLAIAGGSYGGYLVNWAIGHSDRFCAAISDRSVFNRHSAYGTSDIGHLREFEFDNGPPWETGERYRAQSPLSYIGGATTPTLVIHSAQDHRCAVEQGEQLYQVLKRLGAPTKLIRFPNESHGLSRSGRPWHRVFRLNAYLEWLDQFTRRSQ
ncbi:MAG: S9 family peptidase [Caldilineaceae bacterium]|nr:S9 family peptidase [Caldilineaceae bacterium]